MNSDSEQKKEAEINQILKNIVAFEGYDFERMDFSGIHYPWIDFARIVLTERKRIKMLRRYPGLDPKEFQARNGRLCIYTSHATREEFGLRVQQVAEALGRSPDRAYGNVGDHGEVDLFAAWNPGEDTENLPVDITNFYSRGCKIDPRTPVATDRPSPQLHPECKAALRELTDK